VRDGQNFYMAEALDWLRQHGVRRINVVNGRNPVPAALRGRPTDYMPLLGPLDEVYVAGAPAFVAAVQDRALAAGAACHADPFLPSQGSLSLRDRVTRLLGHRPRRVAATVAKPEVIAPLGAADSWAAAWNQRAGTRH
jgi:3-phenylpropionate/trans-cinnamate dioxygenase ferredoxin reductase subunit